MEREQDAFEEKESQPVWLSGAAGGGKGSGVRWKAGRDQPHRALQIMARSLALSQQPSETTEWF